MQILTEIGTKKGVVVIHNAVHLLQTLYKLVTLAGFRRRIIERTRSAEIIRVKRLSRTTLKTRTVRRASICEWTA